MAIINKNSDNLHNDKGYLSSECNKIEHVEVHNVRTFNDNFGSKCAFFDVDFGFIYMKSCMLKYNRDKEAYITFPYKKGGDNKYYAMGYFNNNTINDAIIELVIDAMKRVK